MNFLFISYCSQTYVIFFIFIFIILIFFSFFFLLISILFLWCLIFNQPLWLCLNFLPKSNSGFLSILFFSDLFLHFLLLHFYLFIKICLIFKFPHILHPFIRTFAIQGTFIWKSESPLSDFSSAKSFSERLSNDSQRQIIKTKFLFFIMKILDNIHESVLVIKRLDVLWFHLAIFYKLLDNVRHEDALLSGFCIFVFDHNLSHKMMQIIF